jgi:hypothetical protein
MKPLAAVTLIAFAASAASRAIQTPALSTADPTSRILPAALHLRELQSNNATLEAPTVFVAADPWNANGPQLTAEEKNAAWCKAKSRGSQLTKAMMMNEHEAATLLQWPYTQSTWDGDLKPELKKWGYKEINSEMNTRDLDVDGQCDFDKIHELGDAFKAINVDPRPAGKGGPNHCFYVEHMNGPTVIPDEDGKIPYEDKQYYEADGRKYRVCDYIKADYGQLLTHARYRSRKATQRSVSMPTTVLCTSSTAKALKMPLRNIGNATPTPTSFQL